MLSETQILQNKAKYIELVSSIIESESTLQQILSLLESFDFFNKPATTQYHGAYSGGLCEYILRFCFELGSITNAYSSSYTKEDILRVGLFRDIYKAAMYETFNRNVKNETTNKWETKKDFRLKDSRPVYGNVGFSSYMLVKDFIQFTTEQIETICYSSVTVGDLGNIDIHKVRQNYPLVSFASMADFAATYLGGN